MLSILSVSLLAAAVAAAQSDQNHTCAITNFDKVLSCSSKANATTNGADKCCVEQQGLILATQSWQAFTNFESQGQKLPLNTWTLHGLWPNFCDGSVKNYCDASRQYDPDPEPKTFPNGTKIVPYNGPTLTSYIEKFGKYDLLHWMNTYWVNASGIDNNAFWGHEIGKHGNCFTAFEPECYGPQYQKFQDVIDFFETAIMYYKRLPTFYWLQSAGISPSNQTTFSRAQIENALAYEYGAVPYLGCAGQKYNETKEGKSKNSTDAGQTILTEVWYQFHAFGRPQAGNWVPADSVIPSTCAKAPGAIQYIARAQGSESLPYIPL